MSWVFGCINPEEANFEALYSEEVNFLANQGGGYHSNHPNQGGNQGWSTNEGCRDHEENRRTKITITKIGER